MTNKELAGELEREIWLGNINNRLRDLVLMLRLKQELGYE